MLSTDIHECPIYASQWRRLTKVNRIARVYMHIPWTQTKMWLGPEERKGRACIEGVKREGSRGHL